MEKVPFPSCTREAHVKLMKKMSTFFMIFECFLSFSTLHPLVEIHNMHSFDYMTRFLDFGKVKIIFCIFLM